MMSKLKNILFIALLLIVLVLLLSIFYSVYRIIKNSEEGRVEIVDSDFSYNMIKQVNKNYKNTNYLISPYSIEVALSMVREGADSATLDELNSIVPKRKIEDIRINNRINVANALFIKDTYKNSIKLDFKDRMNRNYDSEILIDNFKTPKVINDWAKEKTNGTIDKVMDNISSDFVLGIANAVCLDVEWKYPFECNKTKKETFNDNNKKFDVVMMNNSFKSDVYYFDSDYEEGIILPYNQYDKNTGKVLSDNESDLVFIGIIPKSDINTYISSIDKTKLEEIYNKKKEASSDLVVNLKIPRFSYSFDYADFIDGLKEVGLRKMFTPTADFSNISNMDLYIDQAIHKTFIELNEKGTKASAVSYLGFTKNSIEMDENEVNITFDRPFIYIIKYKDEIVFFGVVYEPERWTNSTITCNK